jgi:hypothetical protein
MRDAISIPVLPIEADCLDWSSDGEIAVGAGESVQVLVRPPSNARNSNKENLNANAHLR